MKARNTQRFDETQSADQAKPLGFITTRVVTTNHTPIMPDPSKPARPTDFGDAVTRMLYEHAHNFDEVQEIKLELNQEVWNGLSDTLRSFRDVEDLFRV